jgi:hypothetical protein
MLRAIRLALYPYAEHDVVTSEDANEIIDD